jgi:diaminopimelate epimerase
MERPRVPFVKMHGLGNDYVYIDEREVEVPADVAHWARILSDRHRGIGSDGLIVLRRDSECPVRMEMVNADGSRSGMCGNGIRCVARLARERGYARTDEFPVAVDAGRLAARIRREGGRIAAVSIDLGAPRVAPAAETVAGPWGELTGVVVDVGNPHFVHRLDGDLSAFPLERIGPAVERHPRFPARTNVGIARVVDRGRIDLRVWERGAGETQACGSGATAAAAAMRAQGLAGDEVEVRVRGGTLSIAFDGAGHAWKTGPAEESFRGSFERGLVE